MALKNNTKKEKEIEPKIPDAVDAFGEFEMVNRDKYDRAVTAVGNADDKRAIITEYDRLGGFIRYQGNKVFNGCFWDFKNRVAIAEPKVRFLKRQAAVVEETVEVDAVEVEDTETPKRGRGRKTTEENAE